MICAHSCPIKGFIERFSVVPRQALATLHSARVGLQGERDIGVSDLLSEPNLVIAERRL